MRGDRLRKIRETRGYTQDKLSELLGMGTLQIYRYENEKTKPDSDTIAQLANILDVSADYLLGISDDPKPNIQINELTRAERAAIAAWRRGDFIEAVRTIINDEKASSGV